MIINPDISTYINKVLKIEIIIQLTPMIINKNKINPNVSCSKGLRIVKIVPKKRKKRPISVFAKLVQLNSLRKT